MAKTPTRRVLLNRAQKLQAMLGPNGEYWVKGRAHGYTYVDGEMVDTWCLTGARAEVTKRDSDAVKDAFSRLMQDCVTTVAKRPVSIVSFNDNKQRRFSGIRRVLKCIEKDAATWEAPDLAKGY